MDKYEYRIRSDEIKQLIAEGNYQQAAEIADTIDWRRVKSVMMLCTISDLYKINRRYEDAKNMLLLAYERRPGGKTICYSLCELCIKTEEFLQAVNYYKEFVQVAPRDSGRYILQYKLYEAQDVGLEERIGVLEELKKRDYREKWAYELAYLYHRVGLATRCVEECDELILWFGEGKYVIKAMELKMLHQPLSAAQQEKYDHRFDPVRTPAAEISEESAEAAGIEAAWTDSVQGDSHGLSGEQSGWERPGENVGEQPYGESEVPAGGMQAGDGSPAVAGTPEVQSQPEALGQEAMAGVYAGWAAQGTEVSMDTRTDWVLSTPKPETQEKAPAPAVQQAAKQPVPEELDIQVKTMDVGAYNTINLQAEIAAGLQEVLAEDGTRTDAITRSIIAPLLESDTGRLEPPETEEADGNDLEPAREIMEGSEVFFGETGELNAVQKEEGAANEMPEAAASEELVSEEAVTEEKAAAPTAGKSAADAAAGQDSGIGESVPKGMEELYPDNTAKIVMDQLRQEMSRKVEQVLTAQPPRELAGVLSQESDGQISLVVPESETVEKQITGQMNFEEILGEWEKLKRENEAKRQEEVRQHVLEQTGNMFTEFEASLKEGLLEQLESEPVEPETEEPEELEIEEIGEAKETEAAEAETEEAAEPEPEAEAETEEPAEPESETEEPVGPEEGEAALEGSEAAEAEEIEEAVAETEEPAEPEPETEAETKEPAELKAVAETEEPAKSESEAAEESREAVAEEPAAEETGESENATPARREKTAARGLTREEKELYAPFIQSRSGRENLVKAIDSISMAAYTGNVIITGEKGMDTLSLAKNMVREIQMADSNFSGKVAKISGQGLNSKNVEDTLGHLGSGALIIQNASELEKPTVEAMQKMLQKENFGIIVFLEDTKKAMDRFLAAYPKLRESFTARMDVEPMSNDSLVAFGRKYAREMEYSIDELGVLALHTRIEERQTLDHVVTVMEVKDIVDEAIRHANRKTLGHFFDILFARRYDEEDMIILTEKDFV
ncbi:MAG: hypothetical protein NC123_08265 [Butyrivibrio sp.]|nr:hypothetical protein [Acetatifactor muris]MCM1559524.1 hypothetical protein [Butyrivibrio sp.]